MLQEISSLQCFLFKAVETDSCSLLHCYQHNQWKIFLIYIRYYIIQKTIIDTLHKKGKPQTLIAKEAGCSQSAVSKHVNRKLSGRKKCGRKRCTTNRENRSIMRIVKQNRFKNLGELHKAGFKASRATTQTCQGIWLQLLSEASYLG